MNKHPDKRRVYRITNPSVQSLIPLELTKMVNIYNQKYNIEVMDKHDFTYVKDSKPQPYTTVESGLTDNISWVEVGMQKQGEAMLAATIEFGMFPKQVPPALSWYTGH